MKTEYGIKAKFASSILERINQVIANLVHTFDLQNIYLDKDDP